MTHDKLVFEVRAFDPLRSRVNREGKEEFPPDDPFTVVYISRGLTVKQGSHLRGALSMNSHAPSLLSVPFFPRPYI